MSLISLDYETAYAARYSLQRFTTLEYIHDPRHHQRSQPAV